MSAQLIQPSTTLEVFEAFEICRGGPAEQVLISAEHASNRLPEGWSWPEADLHLAETHWAWDPGVRSLALELCAKLKTTAVLAHFSRLLADPNRPEGHPDLFRREAEGQPVALNQNISSEEIELRLARYYRPYHAALDAEVAASKAPLCFSLHSFTPVYQGEIRSIEVGVLFNHEQALAEQLQAHFIRAGFDARLNEPYSGRAGLIHSIEQPALKHQRKALELEVRNDLLQDTTQRSRVAEVVTGWLRSTP